MTRKETSSTEAVRSIKEIHIEATPIEVVSTGTVAVNTTAAENTELQRKITNLEAKCKRLTAMVNNPTAVGTIPFIASVITCCIQYEKFAASMRLPQLITEHVMPLAYEFTNSEFNSMIPEQHATDPVIVEQAILKFCVSKGYTVYISEYAYDYIEDEEDEEDEEDDYD